MISWYAADRQELRDLAALAWDSPEQLAASIDRGRILVAMQDDRLAGYLQLVKPDPGEQIELLSMAVHERYQRHGIGTELVERAIAEARGEGARRMIVATASTDTGNLRFYQRLGFRMLRIERDAFTPRDGYPDGLTIDGIPLRDRVWLDLELGPAADETPTEL